MVRAKPLKIDCMGLNPSSTVLFRDPGHLFFFPVLWSLTCKKRKQQGLFLTYNVAMLLQRVEMWPAKYVH